jgi:Ca2+-binding EF-hand superfamily protein
MSYPDFVMFMLAEEDRSSIPALKYWFTCCDLDGDGRISPEEMWHFYRTQLQRVTSLVRSFFNGSPSLIHEIYESVGTRVYPLSRCFVPDDRFHPP